MFPLLRIFPLWQDPLTGLSGAGVWQGNLFPYEHRVRKQGKEENYFTEIDSRLLKCAWSIYMLEHELLTLRNSCFCLLFWYVFSKYKFILMKHMISKKYKGLKVHLCMHPIDYMGLGTWSLFIDNYFAIWQCYIWAYWHIETQNETKKFILPVPGCYCPHPPCPLHCPSYSEKLNGKK